MSVAVERRGCSKTDLIDVDIFSWLWWLRGELCHRHDGRIPSEAEEDMREPVSRRGRLRRVWRSKTRRRAAVPASACRFTFRPALEERRCRLACHFTMGATAANTKASFIVMARSISSVQQLKEIEMRVSQVVAVMIDPHGANDPGAAGLVGVGLETATTLVHEVFVALSNRRR